MRRSVFVAGLTVLASGAGCGGFGGSGGSGFSGSTVAGSTSRSGAVAASSTIPANVSIRQLVVETDRLAISQPGYGQQLQVSGVFSDGRVRDLTGLATWTAQDPTVARIDAKGFATPLAAGTTGVKASWGGLDALGTLDVKASALAAPGATTTTTTTTTPPPPAGPTWKTDVFPLFQSQLSCKACHNAAGPGKMKLSLNMMTDYATFTTSGLIDKANPSGSLVLQKGCGKVSHGGGAPMKAGGPEATTIESWIAGGAPLDATATTTTTPPPPPPSSLPAPDALIVNPGERNIVDANARQQLVVLAVWTSRGVTADVTRAAQLSLSNAAVATVDSDAVLTATGSGGLVISASWQGKTAQAQLDLGSTASLPRGDQPSMVVLPTMTATTGTTGTGTGTTGTTGTGTTGTGTTTTPPPPPPAPTNPTYTANIAAIMNSSCIVCHNGSKEFSLKTYTAVRNRTVPGNSSQSELIKVTKPGGKMSGYIAASDFATLKLWVDQGAKQ